MLHAFHTIIVVLMLLTAFESITELTKCFPGPHQELGTTQESCHQTGWLLTQLPTAAEGYEMTDSIGNAQ